MGGRPSHNSSVLAVAEDVLPTDATGHEVAEDSGDVDAHAARHSLRTARILKARVRQDIVNRR